MSSSRAYGNSSGSTDSGPPPITYCLAQQGAQYLVHSDFGRSFEIDLGSSSAGVQFPVTWYDAVDEQHAVKMPRNITGGVVVKLESPPPAITGSGSCYVDHAS